MPTAVLASDSDLAPGDIVGDYRITGVLGDGSAGRLYAASRRSDDASFALRVLTPECSADRAAVARFVETARAAAELDRRHIAAMPASGELPDGRAYVVSALGEGRTVAQLLAEHPLEPGELVAILRGMIRALDAAHHRGITHGDLRPSNIGLGSDAEGHPRAIVMELGTGIVLPAGPSKSGPVPRSERADSSQGLRDARLEVARDVRALGLFCFESLTGEALAPADEAEPPRISDRRPVLGPHFDDALAALLDGASPPKSARAAFDRIVAAARAAGYEVDAGIPAAPRPSSEESQRIAASTAELLTDPDLAGSAPPGSVRSDTRELDLPLKRSRAWLYALIAVAVLLAIALARWLTASP